MTMNMYNDCYSNEQGDTINNFLYLITLQLTFMRIY